MASITLKLVLALLAVLLVLPSFSKEKPHVVYDEALVPQYTLPRLLTSSSGVAIKTIQQWKTLRRPEILKLFQENVYGTPPTAPQLKFEVGADEIVFKSRAIKRKVKIFVKGQSKDKTLHLLLYLPNRSQKRFPVFLGLNFRGNEAMDKWPIKTILDQGFALATINYKEIAVDSFKDFKSGILSLYPELQNKDDNFSAIAAWAWGLSRGLDYLETDKNISAHQVVVFGHSRLGKTALLAAATDERFAIAISNNSGEGGASLARRHFGETTKLINDEFPHWFCKKFKKYNDKENELPVDQHMLLALIAPRPLYVASADKDLWADPYGEFLSAKEASVVYKLFGLTGLPTDKFPATNNPVIGEVGYHVRKGEHAMTDYDWQQYLAFAAKHFALSR